MIAFIPRACKVMQNIVLFRVEGVITENSSDEQGGFTTDISILQQILILRLRKRLARNHDFISV
jgi:hypothetical protein